MQLLFMVLDTKLLSEFNVEIFTRSIKRKKVQEMNRTLNIFISILEAFLAKFVTTTDDGSRITSIEIIINNDKMDLRDIINEQSKILNKSKNYKENITLCS